MKLEEALKRIAENEKKLAELRASGIARLLGLGFTADEITALFGVSVDG